MRSKHWKLSVAMLGIAAVAVWVPGTAQASYVADSHDNHAICNHSFSSSDFTFLGTTPTAWDPGVGTARVGGFPAPGGATWSVMGVGLGDVSGFDAHGGATTTAFSALSALDEVALFGTAMDTWAAVSGFTNLGMVADGGGGFGAAGAAGGTGDIRVGAVFIDGASGSNVLAHAYQPGTEAIFGAGGSITGDVHFDNANTWGDGTTGIDFLTVALHELGHALGLGHSSVVGSIMEPVYAGVRHTLHADDIAGIQAIYGPGTVIPEPATMTLLGLGMLGMAYRRRKAA